MSRRLQENLIAGAFVALFVGVIVMSLDFGPRARMIPLPLAIFGLVLTLIQIVWQNVRSTDELHMELIQVEAPAGLKAAVGEAPAAPRDERPSWQRQVGALLIIAALLGLVLALGPVPAVFVFTWGYFLLSRHYSWLRGLIYTAIFTGIVYWLFFVALEIQPYHGLLEPLMERLK
jgi:hypothetical protein